MSRDMPFSSTRLEHQDVDTRDAPPVRFSHRVREIDDEMDSIVFRTIDVIQSRARDNDLRTFYFNVMAERRYDNREFEDLIGMIADVIDIAVSEGKFRDPRDAIKACVDDVTMLHSAYMTYEYPQLMDGIPRSQERDIDRAVTQFESYRKAVDAYRRNGNRIPDTRSRYRDDDRDGRDRGRDRGRPNLGSDRDSRDRDDRGRDRWDRGAMRGGVHGSRRNNNDRANTFGGTEQSDRFEDDNRQSTASTSRVDSRDDRGSRFEDSPNTTRRTEELTPRANLQRLPGRASDIDDALAREAQQGNTNMNETIKSETKVVSTTNPVVTAFDNLDAWLPSVEHPHPFVFSHMQELFYELDLVNKKTIPRLINKDTIVDFYAHGNMSFGSAPKDFTRFEDGGVAKRLNELHDALINPTQDFQFEGKDDKVTYHRRLNVDGTSLSFSMKDSLLKLNYHRYALELRQPTGEVYHPVEIAVGRSMLIDPFICSEEEAGLLEELRTVSSFTKLNEKLRGFSKKISPELFLQVDRHITRAINRMLRQNLSIPELRITSFCSDWLELFSLVTEQYGNAYRDGINTFQESEIRYLLGTDAASESYVTSQLPEEVPGVRTFVTALPMKLIFLKEVSFNMDIDMVPDVASQILPESNPFFHDLAQDLLTKDADRVGRFYIQTADLRTIEASRSYLNSNAILLRMVQ